MTVVPITVISYISYMSNRRQNRRQIRNVGMHSKPFIYVYTTTEKYIVEKERRKTLDRACSTLADIGAFSLFICISLSIPLLAGGIMIVLPISQFVPQNNFIWFNKKQMLQSTKLYT